MHFTPRLLLALGTTLLLPLLSHASPTSTPSDNNMRIVLDAARAAAASISQAELANRRIAAEHFLPPVEYDPDLGKPDLGKPKMDGFLVFSYGQATPQAGLLVVLVHMKTGAASLSMLVAAEPGADGRGGLRMGKSLSISDLAGYALPGLRVEGSVLFFQFFWDAVRKAKEAAAAGQQAYVAEVVRQLGLTEGWMPM